MSGPNSEYDPVQVTPLDEEHVQAMREEALAAIAAASDLEELKKVRRVIGRLDPSAPHEVLLVLDAGQGQNALAQAQQFHQAVGVTGLVMTKLDGTAKGGIVLAIADTLKLPIRPSAVERYLWGNAARLLKLDRPAAASFLSRATMPIEP